MSKTAKLGLFGAYGIELEYMIVDRNTLAVRPIADKVLAEMAGGEMTMEVELGDVAWSNELVLHVMELKCNGPQPQLRSLMTKFQEQITLVNGLLKKHDAMLMPTAMHPFFDPARETKLWPHDNEVIYATYNKIFDCRGHGWSNLQSTHINFPFANDAEFGRLHAAIRLVLPLIPGLAASSPICEGKVTGRPDNRLDFYRRNQQKIPSVTGHVIPERVFTRAAYEQDLLEKIYRDIAPFDPDHVLQYEWLNSRGAIARFDRDAIEIRLLDIQESVPADLAVASAVISLVKGLCDEVWSSTSAQRECSELDLEKIFLSTLEGGGNARVTDQQFLKMFGCAQPLTVNELWRAKIQDLLSRPGYPVKDFATEIQHILKRGSLSAALVGKLGKQPSRTDIEQAYQQLARHLATGEILHG